MKCVNMSEYHAKVSHLLSYSGDYTDVNDGVQEFMQELCKMEEELLELEADVSNLRLDTTGWQATQKLSELESRQNQPIQDINQAHEAVRTLKLTRLERNPGEDFHHNSQTDAYDHQDDFNNMLHRLELISDRTGRRIDAKRNSANTRMVLTASVCALFISLSSLLVSIT